MCTLNLLSMVHLFWSGPDYISWILVGVGAILGLIGICVYHSGFRDLEQAKASVDWPTSPGKVLSSSVVEGLRDDDGVTYYANVVYEFNVNNTTYSGKRIAYGYFGSIYGDSRTLHMPKKL